MTLSADSNNHEELQAHCKRDLEELLASVSLPLTVGALFVAMMAAHMVLVTEAKRTAHCVPVVLLRDQKSLQTGVQLVSSQRVGMVQSCHREPAAADLKVLIC